MPDHAADRQRIRPAHRVGELDELDVEVVVARDAHQPVDQADHVLRGRDVAFVVAAERRHHAHLGGGHARLPERVDALLRLDERLLDRAVGVLLRERLARGHAEASLDVELLRRHRAVHALRVEVHGGVPGARRAREAGDDLLRVGHLRNPLRADERHHLDLGKWHSESMSMKRIFSAVGHRVLLDLHALARAELVNGDAFWQCHGSFLRSIQPTAD